MRNSSYNLIPILSKLCRHCDHALKICMWYNLNIVIFWTFLHLESDLPVGGINTFSSFSKMLRFFEDKSKRSVNPSISQYQSFEKRWPSDTDLV